MGHSATLSVSGEPFLCFLGTTRPFGKRVLWTLKFLDPKKRRPKLPPNMVTKKSTQGWQGFPADPPNHCFTWDGLLTASLPMGIKNFGSTTWAPQKTENLWCLRRWFASRGISFWLLLHAWWNDKRNWIVPIYQNIERHYNQPNLNILYLWYWPKSWRKVSLHGVTKVPHHPWLRFFSVFSRSLEQFNSWSRSQQLEPNRGRKWSGWILPLTKILVFIP